MDGVWRRARLTATRVAATGALAGLLAGCGTDAPVSTTYTDASTENVLLAVMGGNLSCDRNADGDLTPRGMDMEGPFRELRDELEGNAAYDVDYILSCYGQTDDDTVHYVNAAEPRSPRSGTAEEYFAAVEAKAETRESTRLIVAGHSYGGWLAMKTVLGITHAVDHLVTIDPISRVTCSFDDPWGCTSAPTDIEPPQREEIASASRLWSNFYQTKTFYLHASPIDEAHENEELPVRHTRIETHGDVWERMASEFGTFVAGEEKRVTSL